MPSAEWIALSPYPVTHVADKSARRSHRTVRRIMDKPTDLILHRDSETLEAQTVRLEGKGGTTQIGDRQGGNQTTYLRQITVVGVRGHPTLPDLDIQTGDRFGVNGDNYVVRGVTLHAGEIQAAAERIQA